MKKKSRMGITRKGHSEEVIVELGCSQEKLWGKNRCKRPETGVTLAYSKNRRVVSELEHGYNFLLFDR